LPLTELIYFFSDKPLPPQGPLDVSDITPETCSLSWRPPLDDGGSPITNYVVEKLDPFTGVSVISFHWISFDSYDKLN
jgi:hypothetical protein